MTGTSKSAHSDYAGKTLDNRYTIQKLLGRGGMGAVYLGKHVKIRKRVAVKFLHSEFASSPSLVKRFYREAQAASSIEHNNIINVTDVGVSDQGEPYLVMEYLEGESLAELLERSGPIDLAAACGILEPALSALSAAHEKGIVHRDLKPENIFLVYARDAAPAVKLIDFGISKFLDPNDDSCLTQTGTMLGTPAYMAPEQVRGDKDIDHRADIYAVGVILYKMLTGKLPFQGQHFNELLVNILTAEPIPPKDAYSEFPEAAETIVMQLLSREPSARPQSASAVTESLQQLSEYKDRLEKLSIAAAGATHKTFASGDLGPKSDAVEDGRNVAAEIISQMGEETERDRLPSISPQPAHRALIGTIIALGAVLIVLTVVVIFFLTREEPAPTRPVLASPTPAASPATPVAKKQDVLIEIEHLPDNASVFYNGILMPSGVNPFPIPQGDTPVRLEIKAAGYKTASYRIIPSRDQVIHGKMTQDVPPEAEEKDSEPPEDNVEPKKEMKAGRGKKVGKEKPVKSEPPKTDSKFVNGYE